jgi:hypothetical protein
MALACDMSRTMMERYRHAKNEAKRKSVDALNMEEIKKPPLNFPHSQISWQYESCLND